MVPIAMPRLPDMQTPRMLAVAAMACTAWIATSATALGDGPVKHTDSFENGDLDEAFWSIRRMGERRHWIERHVVRHGKKALAIRVKGTDTNKECGCQQNEVRERGKRRLSFGQDAWYAFSMHLSGQAGRSLSNRWVIGGWKQETNGSAFIAQRYDSGVFHITLESGNTRVLLATSQGPAPSFIDLLKKGILEQFSFVGEPVRYRGTSDVKIEYGDEPLLPNPRDGWVEMLYRVKGGLKGDGIVEVYANGKFIARATGTIGVHDMGGPSQYFKIGHNRAPMTGVATLFVDNFRRGATRSDVEGD